MAAAGWHGRGRVAWPRLWAAMPSVLADRRPHIGSPGLGE